MSTPADPRVETRRITRVVGGGSTRAEDDPVAVERALEIRVDGRTLVVTLRTPGHDPELALGFLAAEGVIRDRGQVARAAVAPADCDDRPDVVDIALAPGVSFDWTRLERHFAATSACGLCGRAHLDSLRAGLTPMPVGTPVDAGALAALSARVREAQVTFSATGGLHGVAYCDDALAIRVVREDVGRHNAVDKVAGWLVESGNYPAGSGVLWVSGRAGAEIVLKAARARIPLLAAVGAPSTLAIDLAEAAGMTLIGFMSAGGMNVYTVPTRLG